jgi:hypothetical protein
MRALVAQGLKYRQIGERMGRSNHSIKNTLSKASRGKLTFIREDQTRERELIIGLFEDGYTPAHIARTFKWSINRVLMRLYNAGLDRAERQKIRRSYMNPQLDEPTIDTELRKAWDDALFSARSPATLYERAHALDVELARIESGARAAFIIAGRSGFGIAQMRRITALRQTLDLLCFLDRNQKDEVLSRRLRELKEKEGAKHAPMVISGK